MGWAEGPNTPAACSPAALASTRWASFGAFGIDGILAAGMAVWPSFKFQISERKAGGTRLPADAARARGHEIAQHQPYRRPSASMARSGRSGILICQNYPLK